MPDSSTLLTANRPDTLSEVRLLLDQARRDSIPFFPSPMDWRDELLYFLLPDRFSDGLESSRELLTRQKINALRTATGPSETNWQQWAASGRRWQGGTINGITSKLDYLEGLGITTLWIAPVFKQRVRLDTFHGYGVQDFLDVDPRFGTRSDLVELVKAAHLKGMRIILDIIINHSGDNWGYVPPQKPVDEAINEPRFKPFPDFYGNPSNSDSKDWQLAWRDDQEQGFSVQASDIVQVDQGVWPRELQQTAMYTRAGKGDLGNGNVADPHAEHKRTDFFSLKDFALDAPGALSFLSDCFKYWIALTDCDGFRIDTLKHISLEEARNFCGSIREFADTLGKRNFFLVGEIAGGDEFQDYFADNLAVLQRNLSAALDIGNARIKLQGIGKGMVSAKDYFDDFNENSQGFGSHRSLGNRHVSILDDHDHVSGEKVRFSAEIGDNAEVKDYQIVAATAFQLFILGIPCIYYGTEQAFSGPPKSQIPFLIGEGWKDGSNFGDRYLRETMFGADHPRAHHSNDQLTQLTAKDESLPGFGPFGTSGLHCFDTKSPAYVRLAHLCALRAKYPVLRIGRQYERQTRNFDAAFQFPAVGELVAWSRLLDNQEALCCVNCNGADNAVRGGDVIVSSELWKAGTAFTVVANTEQVAAEAAGNVYNGLHAIGSKIIVKGGEGPGAPTFVEIRDIRPAEVLVLVKEY
ncbi:alpha-amylase family glycosyl hydrolase [Dyadobacter psychrophilus]|uniref:Glycosidase n=1 Tax=Dyadobacter psychrophilus TaxID=651661 RepID=A0A1T5E690_9BACT|nr:alpha-amylase family glycosyl hydrolase [Dyadobacter psychrophilus]SKB79478.1 Glycosidase [Dyadobacter psychrophilus]